MLLFSGFCYNKDGQYSYLTSRMPVTLSSPQPRRRRSPDSGELPIRSQPSISTAARENRPAQTAIKKQRISRLDNPYWRPYRNDLDLAQRLHDLTHPDAPTFADLAREAALARELAPYQEAVVRLSELLK